MLSSMFNGCPERGINTREEMRQSSHTDHEVRDFVHFEVCVIILEIYLLSCFVGPDGIQVCMCAQRHNKSLPAPKNEG